MRIDLPSVEAHQYLQPLREGGSLPAVVDTGDGLYVVKFRGAGQGPRALIAELIFALLARELGLPVPEPAIVTIAPGFAADQRDPEIRELVQASYGTNVGLRYLDSAFNYDSRAAGELIDPDLASAVVWLDAYLTNPDRTARNPNLMIWDRRPWLIDHGTALYAHHDWATVDRKRTRSPFPMIREHVLLTRAEALERADERLAGATSGALLQAVLAAVPDALLMDPLARSPFASAGEARARYVEYLTERLREPRAFLSEAVAARERRLAEAPKRLETRR